MKKLRTGFWLSLTNFSPVKLQVKNGWLLLINTVLHNTMVQGWVLFFIHFGLSAVKCEY